MSVTESAEKLVVPMETAVGERTFAWRPGVVIRLAAVVHARILTTVYLVWVCHRLIAPGARDPYTLFFALMLVFTYFLSLGLFALLCGLAPRQRITVTPDGIVRRMGRRESRLDWSAVDKIEHAVDADGQLVVMSLFARGRRELVFTEGFPLDALASEIHLAAGSGVPTTLARPVLDLRFPLRHWPLTALTFAILVALGMEWLPRWLG